MYNDLNNENQHYESSKQNAKMITIVLNKTLRKKKETQKSALKYCTYSSISCPNTSWTCFSDFIMSPILLSIWVRSTLITWKMNKILLVISSYCFLSLKLHIRTIFLKSYFPLDEFQINLKYCEKSQIKN